MRFRQFIADSIHRKTMNPELWQKFDKLRGLPFSGHEALVEFFQKEGIRFAPSDLGTWGQFFAARFGRMGGMFHVPEWLARVFGALAKDVSPKSICDPWAGTGFLVEVLREACRPTEALAFTQILAEYELGKVLVPEVFGVTRRRDQPSLRLPPTRKASA